MLILVRISGRWVTVLVTRSEYYTGAINKPRDVGVAEEGYPAATKYRLEMASAREARLEFGCSRGPSPAGRGLDGIGWRKGSASKVGRIIKFSPRPKGGEHAG